MRTIVPHAVAALTLAAAACAAAAISVPPPPLVPGEQANAYDVASYPKVAHHVVDDAAVTVLLISRDASLEAQNYALLGEGGHVLGGHRLDVGDVIDDGAIENTGAGLVLVQTSGGEILEIGPGRNLVVEAQPADGQCQWKDRFACDCGGRTGLIAPSETPSDEPLEGAACYSGSEFHTLEDCVPVHVRACE